jgi:sugar diacid utilization regulator
MTPRTNATLDASRRDALLATVTEAAARVTGAPPELLGSFPETLLTILTGERADGTELREVTDLGRVAAERGIAASSLVSLYLSAALHLWRALPPSQVSADARSMHLAGTSVLSTTNDAVEALITGHQIARQRMIRREQTTRQEFIDDLLRGDADVARMVARAQPFGLDLTAAHHVVLAGPSAAAEAGVDVESAALALERRVVERFGDREVLVATKDGRIVVVLPGTEDAGPAATETTLDTARMINSRLEQTTGSSGRWRVAAGRAFAGYFGVARSYEEAREALHLAERLGLHTSALSPGQLLVHRVIARDQAAAIDLVRTVLGPLQHARGGPEPFLSTLRAYFDCSETATEAARRLHVSVRTITYHLDRIAALTGYHASDPDQGFVLNTAVRGAALLDWPAQPLPAGTT